MVGADSISACLIVDDFPANASYWARIQQTAFGYKAPETGPFGQHWRAQAQAPFFPVRLLHHFADFVDEFGVRGKFTVLPCPGGVGCLDGRVRGYSDGELQELLTVLRDRIAPRFDITPEVLTHSMAYDPESETLAPHAETAWLTHLSASGRQAELRAYLRHAWTILGRVGLQARGVTIGGMADPSNIGKGESLLSGHHRTGLAEAALAISKEFAPGTQATFLYTGSPPLSEASRVRGVPETIYTSLADDNVFELHSAIGDPLLGVFDGAGDVAAETDKLMTPDLARGALVDCVEAGRVPVITVHAQTLNALNTGFGLQILREGICRFQKRYGQRIVWRTAMELWDAVGEKRDTRCT